MQPHARVGIKARTTLILTNKFNYYTCYFVWRVPPVEKLLDKTFLLKKEDNLVCPCRTFLLKKAGMSLLLVLFVLLSLMFFRWDTPNFSQEWLISRYFVRARFKLASI